MDAPAVGKRLPAYARALVTKRQNGLAPTNGLLIAADWNRGKRWAPWRVVVAPNDDPAELDFAVAAGLSCLLIGYDQARNDNIARSVILFEPLGLIGVRLGDNGRVTVYVPHPQITKWNL
jgi:hypothetical protein